MYLKIINFLEWAIRITELKHVIKIIKMIQLKKIIYAPHIPSNLL